MITHTYNTRNPYQTLCKIPKQYAMLLVTYVPNITCEICKNFIKDPIHIGAHSNFKTFCNLSVSMNLYSNHLSDITCSECLTIYTENTENKSENEWQLKDDSHKTQPNLTPLQELTNAVQKFVNARAGEPQLLRGAVLCWESMCVGENGQMIYNTNYVSFENTSMSETVGLLDLAKSMVKNDILGDD